MNRRDFTKGVGALFALPHIGHQSPPKPDMTDEIDMKIVGSDEVSGCKAAYIKAVAVLDAPDYGAFNGVVTVQFRDSEGGDRIASISKEVSVSCEDSEAVVTLDWAETQDEAEAIEAVGWADFTLEAK